jgi:hypothetical protein
MGGQVERRARDPQFLDRERRRAASSTAAAADRRRERGDEQGDQPGQCTTDDADIMGDPLR